MSVLSSIHGPEDLKALPEEKLERLAAEIRELITEVVEANGGHLASNLGAVELTIALHRSLDLERDRLIFDVGHQSYAHKILTGRAGSFRRLRQRGGLSGFPNPEESPYDLFVTGHASTAISTALGLACAMKGAAGRAVAVIGDGAIAAGLAFEGLNHAGHLGFDLLVVLNDNEMAISRTVGAFAGILTRVRLDPRYNRLRTELRKRLQALPVLRAFGDKLTDLALHTLTPGGVFQDLGFRYLGPVDGHDLSLLEREIRSARALKGPVLLHVVTQKGEGHLEASTDPAKFHSCPPKKVRLSPKRPSYTDAAAGAVVDLASRDDRIVAITAAMPDGTGLSQFAERFPDRFFDVGICEPHAVTFAAGLARGGMRPVVALYSTFLQRAYDSVFHDLCLQRTLGAVLCVDRAGLVGQDGPTHHGLYDIAFLRALPGIVLCAPRDGGDLKRLIEWAVEQPRPVAIRYPRAALPDFGEIAWAEGLGPAPPPELGRAEVLREGEGIALIAYGSTVIEAAKALARLEADGIRPTLVNARFAKPVDERVVSEVAASHGKIITLEEGTTEGGFGSAVLEAAERAGRPEKAVLRLGVPDRFIAHARREEQLAEVGLDAAAIAEVVRRELKR